MSNPGGPHAQKVRWFGSLPCRLVVPALLLAAVSGCAPPGEDPASAAQAFHAALGGHDLAAACALLAPATSRFVAKDGGGSCPTGLEDAGLTAVGSDGRATSTTQVFGRSALVTLGAENVFLTHSGTRWLVDAAGCTAVEDAPFDCEIGGG